jgi:hypothetical protein
MLRFTALMLLLAAAEMPAAVAETAAEAELPGTVHHLQEAALADSTALELVRSLTAEVGPRFAGTPGDRAAVEWAVAAMNRLGLENVRTDPVAVPRWIRGQESGRIVAPHPQRMVLVALGGSIGTPSSGIEAEVVEFESVEALEELAEGAIEGKIAFINKRMARARDGSGYGETVRGRSRGPGIAARKGAVALLIRSVGTGPHRFAHTGATRYEEGVRRIPAVALAIPDADVLETQLKGEDPVTFHLFLGSRYLEDGQSANVIGEIIGRERPEEIVLLGAHLDSWDVGQGAIDDGSGVATVLAAGALIGSLPEAPRRTVRIVLFANEEFGLSGAKAYAEAHADELDKHQLATESDFGPGRIWRFATRMHPLDLPHAEEFSTLLEPLGVDWFENTAWGGADLRPSRETGMPVADLTPDGTYYFDYHHTEDDTFDKIVPEDLSQSVAAIVSLAYFAAETPVTFRRVPAEAPK